MMGSYLDITGNRYGRLLVISFCHRNKKNYYWRCLCDCGNETSVQKAKLLSGHTTSCGCYQQEMLQQAITKHGRVKSPIYKTWCSMKSRCLNPNNKAYKNYGGRGIKVCERWLESFENFYADMGERPPKHSLDRIDSNGDYCKENCRWADRTTQNQNMRSNVNIEYEGQIYCLAELCRKVGLSYKVAGSRYRQLKWPIDKIFPGAKLVSK